MIGGEVGGKALPVQNAIHSSAAPCPGSSREPSGSVPAALRLLHHHGAWQWVLQRGLLRTSELPLAATGMLGGLPIPAEGVPITTFTTLRLTKETQRSLVRMLSLKLFH